MMYTTDWDALGLAADPFVGGVTLSGVHDLKPLVMASMNSDLRLTNAEAARVSPVNHASLSLAPLLIAVGGAETSEFIRQAHARTKRREPFVTRANPFEPLGEILRAGYRVSGTADALRIACNV